MPRATQRPPVAVLVLLIGAALTLSGCFGDDDPIATGPSGDDHTPPDDGNDPVGDLISDVPELPPPAVSVTFVNDVPAPEQEPEVEIEEPAAQCDLLGRNVRIGLLGLGIGIDTCL